MSLRYDPTKRHIFFDEPGAIEVRFTPFLMTRDVYSIEGILYVHSREAFNLMQRGVLWHDREGHCSTWTEAAECRCDVEPPL